METVDKFKYLGVWLTPNLSFKVAIEESRLKLARITGMIPSLFKSFDELPIEAIRLLYKSVVLSTNSYGAEL